MQKNLRVRGRPRNSRYSTATSKVLESLARIALRKGIDLDAFFNALVDAWIHNEATCQKLIIKCRKRKQDSVIFLFTIKQKIVAQFSVPILILQKNNPIKDYIDTLPANRFSVKKPRMKNTKIRDLKQRMKHVNLKARVLETPEPKMIYTRWGAQAFVSNVLLADETGTIKLSLWNQQINKVSVNDVVKLENVNVTIFRGDRQLRLRRNSALTVIEGEGFLSTDDLKKL